MPRFFSSRAAGKIVPSLSLTSRIATEKSPSAAALQAAATVRTGPATVAPAPTRMASRSNAMIASSSTMSTQVPVRGGSAISLLRYRERPRKPLGSTDGNLNRADEARFPEVPLHDCVRQTVLDQVAAET